MKFGPLPVEDAAGAILAHAVVAGERRYRKAHRIAAEDAAAMKAAGIAEVIAACLDPGDIDEDEAATRLASALNVEAVEAKPAATGRVNLHAQAAGVFTVDKTLIEVVNRVDPAVTIATLEDHAPVTDGQMVATVKIIPFALPAETVDRAIAACRDRTAFSVHPFRAARVGLVQTVLPGLKASVLDKTARITATRLERSGSAVTAEKRPPHEVEAVTRAIGDLAPESDMLIVFGGSAVSDSDDVIPAAVRSAGGTVERVGMPVDPGNLLVLGRLGDRPVIGAPGCARSPKINGFDWVLDRHLAGLDVTGEDIAGMGVGGLLTEIPTRPQPREAGKAAKAPRVAAVLLAAGRSSRMGGPNKLLAAFNGAPLVSRIASALAASKAERTIVVTGHQRERVREALSGIEAVFVDNPDFAAGLSTSLKAGIGRLPPAVDGALVALGDMPEVTAADLDALIDAFVKAGGKAVVRATHAGKRGNPVILPHALFADVARLVGDTGARHIVEGSGAEIRDVEIGRAASVDVDTPEAMRRAGGQLVD